MWGLKFCLWENHDGLKDSKVHSKCPNMKKITLAFHY